jgi:hypothetical protein
MLVILSIFKQENLAKEVSSFSIMEGLQTSYLIFKCYFMTLQIVIYNVQNLSLKKRFIN